MNQMVVSFHHLHWSCAKSFIRKEAMTSNVPCHCCVNNAMRHVSKSLQNENSAVYCQAIMKTVRAVPALLLFGVTLLGSFRAIAQPIAVPNFSFESQTAPPFYPYVNTSVDSWQKAPEPAYWPSVQTNYGIPWNGTAGVFLDVN